MRRTMNGKTVWSTLGYLQFLKKAVRNSKGLPAERIWRKILRGVRRRRNWLMRTGQWPPLVGAFHVKSGDDWIKLGYVTDLRIGR